MTPRSFPSLALLVLGALIPMALAHPSAAAPFAYASNEGSASVSVIDTATDKVVKTLKFGQKPRGIAVAPDGKRLYLSDQTANALVVVDLEADKQVARVPLGSSPEAIYLSADGKSLSAAIEEDNQVLIVDTATLAVVKRIKMKGNNPEHAVFSPDGKWLYASAEEADSLDIVDLAKGEVVKSVEVGDRPRGIGFLPDGSRAYVAAENADRVNVFDTFGRTASAYTFPPAARARCRCSTPPRMPSLRRSLSASGRGTWRSHRTGASFTSPAGARTPSRS